MTASMNKLLRQISFSAVLILLSVDLPAQTSQDAPPPADFATAQTAFIAIAGVPFGDSRQKQYVGMIYNGFYQQFVAWNKYKLTASPRDADLAFEISLHTSFSEVTGGSSVGFAYLQLNIRDIKTRALLWTLDEPITNALREKTAQHNLELAIGQLIEDLKLLAAGKQPLASTSLPSSKQP
jgi:hypothetical protein